MKTCKFDRKKAFKTNFMTNDLNGSEDFEVSSKLFKLVGQEVCEFREKLLQEPCPKDLEAMLKRITPPKGIKRKNFEGSELFDCSGEELEESDLLDELNDFKNSIMEAGIETNLDVGIEANVEAPKKNSKAASLSNSSDDPDIK